MERHAFSMTRNIRCAYTIIHDASKRYLTWAE